jgi:hypothetical protein
VIISDSDNTLDKDTFYGTVTLSRQDGPRVTLRNSTIEADIIDNDVAVLRFKQQVYYYPEDAVYPVICVTLYVEQEDDSCPVAFPLKFILETVEDTAMAEEDFLHFSREYTLPTCTTELCVPLEIINTDLAESDESFYVILSLVREEGDIATNDNFIVYPNWTRVFTIENEFPYLYE